MRFSVAEDAIATIFIERSEKKKNYTRVFDCHHRVLTGTETEVLVAKAYVRTHLWDEQRGGDCVGCRQRGTADLNSY